jgi:16S rRNA (cytidine1402-2'-O)-methyltransferase
MTKKFESFYRGNLSQLTEILKSGEIPIKGEFVIVVQGAPATTACPPTELEHLLTILLTELPLKQAVTLTTQWSGSNKNEVYDMALALKAKLKA